MSKFCNDTSFLDSRIAFLIFIWILSHTYVFYVQPLTCWKNFFPVTPPVHLSVTLPCSHALVYLRHSVKNFPKVDPSSLGKASISLLPGLPMDFVSTIAGNPNAFYYSDAMGNEMTVHYNSATGGANGHAMTVDARSFVLEFCGTTDGHVLKEIDITNMDTDEHETPPKSSVNGETIDFFVVA